MLNKSKLQPYHILGRRETWLSWALSSRICYSHRGSCVFWKGLQKDWYPPENILLAPRYLFLSSLPNEQKLYECDFAVVGYRWQPAGNVFNSFLPTCHGLWWQHLGAHSLWHVPPGEAFVMCFFAGCLLSSTLLALPPWQSWYCQSLAGYLAYGWFSQHAWQVDLGAI